MDCRIIWAIIIVVILVIICSLTKCELKFYTNIHREKFTNIQNNILEYNLVGNGSFQNGQDIGGLLKKSECSSIVKFYDNPNSQKSLFVLQQVFDKNNNQGYIFQIKLKPSYHYKLTFWSTTLVNPSVDKIIVLDLKNCVDCVNTNKIETKSRIINTITSQSDNIKWYQYEDIFYLPDTSDGNVIAIINCNPKNVTGKCFVTGMNLLPYLMNASDFKYTIGLQTFLDAGNKKSYQGGDERLEWLDLSNCGQQFKWEKVPQWNAKGFFNTSNNTLVGPSGKMLNVNDKINKNEEFSILILAQSNQELESIRSLSPANIASSEEYLKKIRENSTLYIPGNQDTALDVVIPNNYDNIFIQTADQNYNMTSKKINPQNLNLYTITHKDNQIEIWINDFKFETFNKIPNIFLSRDNILLNEDGNWNANLYSLLFYNIKIDSTTIKNIHQYLTQPKSRQIEPKALDITKIQPLMDIKKMHEKTKEKMEKIKEKCGKETKIKKLVPSIKSIKVEPNCPRVYYKDDQYMVYIPTSSPYVNLMGSGEHSYGKEKDRAQHIYKMNFPKCPLPDILKHKRISHDKCPYIVSDGNPCHSYECRNVDWEVADPAKTHVTAGCRRNISHYCHKYRDLDPACSCWKEEFKHLPACQKHRRHFEPPEDYGFSINVFDITDHPDFKNYIRKDKIPCWNCNLTSPTVKDSIIKGRTW